MQQPTPSSLSWELLAPHQLQPTTEGLFSLKTPRALRKGTLGSGDEAQLGAC